MSTQNLAPCGSIAQTLPEILATRATDHPDKMLFTFIRDDDSIFELTFGEMFAAAQRAAQDIVELAQPGDRVLLLYPPGIDYIVAFVGCLLASVVPVPCYPPTNERNSERVRHIAVDSGVTLSMTNDLLCNKLRQLLSCDAWLVFEWKATTPKHCGHRNFGINSKPEDVAFLQYTSGSTSAPKGVMVTHRNLMHNSALLAENFAFSSLSVGVTWLPPYHDMGLIVGLLQFIYSGGTTVVLSPASFLQRPFRWLRAVSDFRATHIGAPNFAFELCNRRISDDQKKGLDISSLEVVFCGAEPIRTDTLTQFYKSFEQCGFRLESFLPCYGLAEATLLVSGAGKNRGMMLTQLPEIAALASCDVQGSFDRMKGRRLVVGSGRPVEGQRVVIVEPEQFRQLPDGEIGEIWIAGPSVATGYWQNPQATEETFHATLFAQPKGARYLRTGDLGFLSDGELYVCGRLKDLIIINAKNIYPQDVEAASFRSDDALRADGAAAFAIADDVCDKLVVVQEMDFRQKPTNQAIKRIGDAVFDYTGVQADVVLLVKPGAIPRTSSGKIRRRQCRGDFESGKLIALMRWERAALELITQIWAEVLQIDQTDLDADFFALGGHSLLATEILAKLRQSFNIELPMSILLEAPTIHGLAASIEHYRAIGAAKALETLPPLHADIANRYRPFPLSDIQEAYWIGRRSDLTLGGVATHAYLEIRLPDFSLSRFNLALQQLIERHEMLRAIVDADGAQHILEHVPAYEAQFLDLRAKEPTMAGIELMKVREELSHQVLQTDRWPLFEWRATQMDDQYALIHISVDLLIMDAWSIQLLLRELGQLYRKPNCALPDIDISFRDYVLAEKTRRFSDKYASSMQYWRDRLSVFAPAPELPSAISPELIRRPRFSQRKHTLSQPLWGQLKFHAAQAGVTPSAALLSAFALVLATWSKHPRFTINLTLFNRVPLHSQVNDLIGDFTSLIPLEADIDSSASISQTARTLQAQLWKDIDNSCVSGVEILRELNRLRGGMQGSLPIVFTSTLTDDIRHAGNVQDRPFGEIVYCVSQTPQVWLDHQIFERNGVLDFNWDAIDDIFPAGLLDTMFTTYCHLLDRLAREESLWQLAGIDLLPSDQRAEQNRGNATEYPVSALQLHELFEQRAAQHPDRCAVITSHCEMSYAELRQYARHVGNRLHRMGAQPNQLIAGVRPDRNIKPNDPGGV